jgi:site-specific DNA recombinase
LINDSKNCDFDFAIVHKLDRFSRNRYDSAYYKRELKRNGVTLISVLENLDDSPESIILESVLEGMSEYYFKNLSREVMKGMKESALKCQAVGGRPPYGYKLNSTTRKYEINEQEVDAVRLIFKSVSDGIGYSEIITELHRLGYRTRLNNPFGKNSLTEILRNERYKGIYIFNRAVSHNQSGKRNNHKNKPEDEVIRIPGGMPVVVDSEIFDRVAAILKGRTHKTASKKAKENYMLIGKMFCGICSASYTGNRQTSGRNKTLLVTYRCVKRGNHGDRHCTNKDINRNYIEDFVFKRVGEIVFNEKRVPQLIEAYYMSSGEISDNVANKLKSLRSNLNSVEQKITNIISVITKTGSPSLIETLDSLESEKQVLALQISNEEDNMIANKLNQHEIISAYRMAQELYENGILPQRKQLLNLYLKRVLVFPEYVEIELNNVPSNLLTPAQNNNASPVDSDEPCALHNLIKFPIKNTKSRLTKSDGTWDTVCRMIEIDAN